MAFIRCDSAWKSRESNSERCGHARCLRAAPALRKDAIDASGPCVKPFDQPLRNLSFGRAKTFHLADWSAAWYRDYIETLVQRDVRELARISALEVRKLQAAAGKRFAGGVVLYDGETSARFGDRMYAVAIRALWEKS
jgi:hypothetical protein